MPVFEAEDGWRLAPEDPPFDPQAALADDLAKRLYCHQVRIGRKGLVQALLTMTVPPTFENHPLLRNLRPLLMREGVAVVAGQTIRLDSELGVTYARKEDS